MGVHPVHAALTSGDIKKFLRSKARQLRRRPEFLGIDLAEIQQDLAAQVLQQADSYDPSRGTAAGFAVAVIDSAAAMLCRYHRRFKRAAVRDNLFCVVPPHEELAIGSTASTDTEF